MKTAFYLFTIILFGAHAAAYAQTTPKVEKIGKDTTTLILPQEIKKVAGATPQFSKERLNLITKSAQLPIAGQKATKDTGSTSAMGSNMMRMAAASPSQQISGSLDVSSTGGATYSIPLNMPPGIGNMLPRIAIGYNSQSGNGTLGLGWNLSGLSAITRIPTTTFHDQKNGGINFSPDDRFALDGQRLMLKSGTYGADGAEYETENYANTKIISRGTSPYGANFGPAYFEVFYPDGSKAIYGGDPASRTKSDYALTYVENAVGARISYDYFNSDNTMIIKEIKYGALGTNLSINKLTFFYDEINRAEMQYIGGERFYRKSLLNRIEISGSNDTRYRTYRLTYQNIPTLNYKRITEIKEYDGSDQNYFGPIQFNYGSTGDIIATSNINSLSVTGISNNNSETITADFTGDGSMDFLLYPKNNKTKFWAFYDIDQNSPYMQLAQEINTGPFKEIFSGTIPSYGNIVLPGQAIIMAKPYNYNSYKFDAYYYAAYSPALFQYDRIWDTAPMGCGYYSECDDQYHEGTPLEQEFISGDFNGDGLTDVLALSRPQYNVITYERKGTGNPWDPQPWIQQNEQPIPPSGDCIQDYGNCDYTQATFINMDRRLTSNFVSSVGYFYKSYAYGDRVLTGDFNGDGKTDILHVSNGIAYVYTLNATYGYLELLWQRSDSRISVNEQLLMGDYNGDGKMDIMFSTGPGTLFCTFLSTGKGFEKYEEYYPFANTTSTWDGNYLREYRLIPSDINGDGKTDIIATYSITQNNNGGWAYVTAHHNMGTAPSYRQHFAAGASSPGLYVGAHYPVPIFLTPNRFNPQLEFGLMSMDAIRLLRFQKDFRSEAQLTSLTQDGITQAVHYKTLGENGAYDEFAYESSYDQIYPYVDLHHLPGMNVVSKITRTFGNQQLDQVFGYSKAVMHLEGLGFAGFGKLVRSNWHVGSSDPNRIFTINLSDPLLRGAPTKTFTTKSPYLNTAIANANISSDGATLNDYINRTDHTYQTQLASNKVLVNIPLSTTTKDMLTGTISSQTNQFDSYYNVTKSTTIHGTSDTKVEDYTYDNNLSGYYIGRVLSHKITTTNAAGSSSSEEEFLYTGFLPTQLKKRGDGTSWVTTTMAYDIFGNKIQSTISTVNNGQRTSSSQYDLTGRFVISTTDAEGMTNHYTTHPVTGNVLTKTNPFGQLNSFLYDNWGRLIETTNHLGKKGYLAYDRISSGYKTTEISDEGHEKVTYTNSLGQVTSITDKNVLGNIVGKATEYDVYGRAYRESQPASPGNYSQWSEIEYDTYGRLKKSTSYTGKVTSISYDGLTTTVSDGDKSVITTKNVLGQTTSVQDPGGTINYTYDPNGQLKTVDYGGSVQAYEYDGWGRQTKITDPSAGIYTYAYNDFGEMINETSPKGTTVNSYDAIGKLSMKTIQGDDTNLTYDYVYDPTTKLLSGFTFTNGDGNNANYNYAYNSNQQLASVTEDNSKAKFISNFSYDAFGRIATETYQAINKRNSRSVSRSIENTYQNGEVLQSTDLATGIVLSRVSALAADGQLSTVLQSNNLSTMHSYDTYNLPQSIVLQKSGLPSPLMTLGYSFDAQKGNINSRSNSAFNLSENFTYDNLDRLTGFNDLNGNHQQQYDTRGRITYNSQLGNYNYSGNSYQQSELVNLTSPADAWYQARQLQEINYNAFSQPVNIKETGITQMSFEYNSAQQRSHRFYGSNDNDKMLRPFQRHYSEDGVMEITDDLINNVTSFVFYLDGDAYSAPAIYKEVQNATATTDAQLYFLHRDHLNSIVMITNQAGDVVEKRAFDAWGNLLRLEDGAGNPLTTFVVLDRGFTGHEHLLDVGLIHMNARLYDPKLHRFVQPDEYVQDPYNSQNYNRYGYGYNNPMIYSDPTGKIFWLIPVLIGAAISITTNGIDNAINNRPFFQGALKAGLIGGISGLASFGIGNMASTMTGFGKVAFQTVAHGYLGGFSSVASGGDFLSGMASGALGSVAAWGSGELLGSASRGWQTVGSISTGATMGGVSAELSGGNFWDGFRNGAISSSLNHAAHSIQQKFELLSTAKKAFGKDFMQKYGVKSLRWGSQIEKDYRGAYFNSKDGYIYAWDGVEYSQSAGITTPERRIYISDAVRNYGTQMFEIAIGHELVHSYHRMKFGSAYNSSYSENAAYKYSYNTAVNYGVHSSYSSFFKSTLKTYSASSAPYNYRLIPGFSKR